MSKARRKLKKTASKPVKRPKPRKARFITLAEARRRAERHVLNRLFKGAVVRDGAEAGGNIYNVRRADTWVVYKKCRGDGTSILGRGGGLQTHRPGALRRLGE